MNVKAKISDGKVKVEVFLEVEELEKLSSGGKIMINISELPVTEVRTYKTDRNTITATIIPKSKFAPPEIIGRDTDMVVAKFVENNYSFRNSLDKFVEDVVADILSTENITEETLKDILYSNAILNGIVKDFFIYRELWRLKRKYIEMQKEAERIINEYRNEKDEKKRRKLEKKYRDALAKNKLLTNIINDISDLLEMNPFIIPVYDEDVAVVDLHVEE